MKNKKSKKQVNPEIEREKSEKRKAATLYEDDDFGMTLFPGVFMGSAVSATESTGLIQVTPVDPELLGVYDEIYSYRRTKPEAKGE